MLRTLGRAARVLDLFTVECPEWGATAVAHELGIAKSQAHELLFSLADGGLLQRVGAGRYRLGWRIVALNSVLVETSDLLRLAAPVMRALVARFGETVHVAAWDGRPVCIDARLGRLSTSIPPFRVGEDLPADSTALGKVLLAGQPRDEIERFLSCTERAPRTERTAPTTEDVQIGLGRVAAQGFAYEEQEHRAGICCVAAPIVNREAGVYASLGMSVPVDRWDRGRLGYRRAVVAVAEHLARRSGGLPHGSAPTPGLLPA
jgi:DNA-binding IclR family transcriptional regulator